VGFCGVWGYLFRLVCVKLGAGDKLKVASVLNKLFFYGSTENKKQKPGVYGFRQGGGGESEETA